MKKQKLIYLLTWLSMKFKEKIEKNFDYNINVKNMK